jgi:glycerol-1-phosphate dehydrogenase [NAD(P)+]
MEFPRVLAYDDTEDEVAAGLRLAEQLIELGVESPFVLSSAFGAKLAAQIDGPRPPEGHVAHADQRWARRTASTVRRSGADAIIAVGGGRCLDVAKLVAARAGLTVVAVPTQLSHDGICSPVAVVPDDSPVGESIGAVAPRAVFLSIPTLMRAPVDSVRAGIGDLFANPLALRDWGLAARRGLEVIDQKAWDMSAESFELIKPHLDADLNDCARDPEFLRRLADALILSGAAMILAGSSRPASGAEHEISHALDGLFEGRALHGAQVAFGCIPSIALYGEDAAHARDQLARLGLPQHPSELGLSEADTVRVLLEAPDTRPGRFTILEDADLDEAGARSLVRSIWT